MATEMTIRSRTAEVWQQVVVMPNGLTFATYAAGLFAPAWHSTAEALLALHPKTRVGFVPYPPGADVDLLATYG